MTTIQHNSRSSYTGAAPTGYDAAGNVTGYTDSVNGVWSNLSPDSLNRLLSATYTPAGAKSLTERDAAVSPAIGKLRHSGIPKAAADASLPSEPVTLFEFRGGA